ncbi:MAG TPA: STAS domain-containing protein [Streptosporangiaceae bacterium]|nr:STAS domain-containing protein [Streptosporangiaceae bacterium]
MLDIDVGLRPLQPEAVCLIPVIRVRCEPEYVLITLTGDVDFAAVASLRERLFALAARGRPMVADLDRVSFIDAAGLGVLAGAGRRASVHGASLYAVCARRLFRMTKLDRVIPLAGTIAEALQLALGPDTAVAAV